MWDDSDQETDIGEYDRDVNMVPKIPSFEDSVENEHTSALVLWFIGFMLSLQAKYYIPDSAINILIKFLYGFFKIVNCLSKSTIMDSLIKCVPSSLYKMRKSNSVGDTFIKFVVRSKCCKIYT